MNHYTVISHRLNQVLLVFKLKAMREQNDDTKEGSSVQKIKTEDPELFFSSLWDYNFKYYFQESWLKTVHIKAWILHDLMIPLSDSFKWQLFKRKSDGNNVVIMVMMKSIHDHGSQKLEGLKWKLVKSSCSYS